MREDRLRTSGGSEFAVEEEDEEEEDEDEDEDEDQDELLEGCITGLVFSSLRCLFVTCTELASCSGKPGVAEGRLLSKSGNCMGGTGPARRSTAGGECCWSTPRLVLSPS